MVERGAVVGNAVSVAAVGDTVVGVAAVSVVSDAAGDVRIANAAVGVVDVNAVQSKRVAEAGGGVGVCEKSDECKGVVTVNSVGAAVREGVDVVT